MRTGRADIRTQHELTPHVKAIVTGATSVFARELCQAMFQVQHDTGCEDLPSVAKACASQLMCSDKCAALEKLVADVVSSDDGMPQVENTELLAEVLRDYSELSGAASDNTLSDYRTETLVPSIVEQAMESVTEDTSEELTLEEVQTLATQWDSFVPVTAFQQIVHDCISKIGI